MGPQFDPRLGVNVDIHIRLLYTIGISCTVWPQYTTRQPYDRQTSIGIDRLFGDIDQPKKYFNIVIERILRHYNLRVSLACNSEQWVIFFVIKRTRMRFRLMLSSMSDAAVAVTK